MSISTRTERIEQRLEPEPRLEPMAGQAAKPVPQHVPAQLAYCGVCRELYEFIPGSGDRCPLCGFRPGEP
jgi:hypothetical protein